MIYDYYDTTDRTGTSYYNRNNYLDNTAVNTGATSTQWHTYASIQHIVGTYITGQESYYDQYCIQRYLDQYQRGNQGPHQQENQAPQQPPQKTPEQLRIEAEAKRAEVEAKERAKILLLEYLDAENRQRLLDNKPLEIASKLFNGIKYNIPISKTGKIEAIKENKIVTKLCLLVKEPEYLPIEDVVLTKLLHVLNDETNMLKTANHSNVQENLLAGLN